MFTSSGKILGFRVPALGCSPLPLKRVRGSILKFETRSNVLSTIAYLRPISFLSLEALRASFWSFERLFFSAFFCSKWVLIAEKSKSSKFGAGVIYLFFGKYLS